MEQTQSKRSLTSLGDTEEVKRVFNKFDANGDGKISVSELRSVFRALGSDNTSPEELQAVVTEIDKDGDGAIDLKKFTDFHSKKASDDGSTTGNSKEISDAFEMYDRDHNGLISARELQTVMRSLGEKCSMEDCARMIKSVDMDGDGRVNFEEFKKMMTPSK